MITPVFEVGDFAEVVGLVNSPELNGEYVEITREAVYEALKTESGEMVDGYWYGIVGVANRDIIGGMRPQNLKPIDRRSVCLHLFGEEDYP